MIAIVGVYLPFDEEDSEVESRRIQQIPKRSRSETVRWSTAETGQLVKYFSMFMDEKCRTFPRKYT